MSQWYAWCPTTEGGCGYLAGAQDTPEDLVAKVVADGGKLTSGDCWDNTEEPAAPGLIVLTCPTCRKTLRRREG